MSNRRLLDKAIADLIKNPEQYDAVHECGHCIVRAGPGSGKTRTLTVAMARALLEDVEPPRGIACITYNNECALELESRLANLGIEPNERIFIGTVHSFALTQVIMPYARCVLPELSPKFHVATSEECKEVIEIAHKRLTIGINVVGKAQDKWRLAEAKRRKQVDRTHASWRHHNPELASFIEIYEEELRKRDAIDFDDMPLIAFRMIQQHAWIHQSLQAKYPILFVDEYQDLGHVLHALVLKLCFEGGMRLFAVGDPDQSIYAFTGADPELMLGLMNRDDVRDIELQLNYRCGKKIIEASKAALGEERVYQTPDGTADGNIRFMSVDGNLKEQALFVAETIIPDLLKLKIKPEEIAVLYRNANQGNMVAMAISAQNVPIVRADNQALIRRNSRLSRFVESCARWAAGGWKHADPPFRRLSSEATMLIMGTHSATEIRREIELSLITFLKDSIEKNYTAHTWLNAFHDMWIVPWQGRALTATEDWSAILQMIDRTDPLRGEDMPLTHLGGYFEDSGRLNLSTLHSSKGREFDAVILFAMNNDVLPTQRDKASVNELREARRLFYVGVTRARQHLYIVYQKKCHSPWVKELYDRVK